MNSTQHEEKKMHYRSMMHMVLAILGICIALSQGAVAATRLGLHVTQEELTIWRQRMTDNVNGINGYSFQSIYQNRILADANLFRSQPHPSGDGFWAGYTGPGCVPVNDQFIRPGRANGGLMARSAFNFLLTGDPSYAAPVRQELLSQIAAPGTDWANGSKWCSNNLGGTNILEIVPWIFHLTTAFDYLNAGGYTGLSTQEKTNIMTWLHNAAILWDAVQVRIIQNFTSYSGIYNTPQALTCVGGCPGSRLPDTYWGGYPVYTSGGNTFYGQLAECPQLAMAVGLMTNDQTLINHAVAYVTAFFKAGIYDNGAVADFRRWSDCNPALPGKHVEPCCRSNQFADCHS
jgi:hypothetical protein